MTSHEKWIELKQIVNRYSALDHVGEVGTHRGDQRFHDGFNTALNWVEKQMEELEEK